MTNSLVSELAQRLGKSEEEVIQFLQTLWQILPPSPKPNPTSSVTWTSRF